jgi:azurin
MTPRILALCLTTALAPAAEFHMKTLTAQMRYDQSEFTASPGEKVTLHFENGDDLPHNVVICKPGTDTLALSNKQMEKPEEALKRNWLPDDPRIIAHTQMLNPHQRETITFIMPEKPGRYPIVCTFPGHALTMKGTINSYPQGPGLKSLTFKLYHGAWENLPDFSKLKPHREGSVSDGIVKLNFDDYKNEYGLVFEGTITPTKKGNHRFMLASDDGARLLLDDQEVINNDGIHPSGSVQQKSLQMAARDYRFRLEYFQRAGHADLFVAWKGADFAPTLLSKWAPKDWQDGGTRKKAERDTTGMPLIVNDEPVIYRNFIQGAGNRGIGVGYPGGINIAWSAEGMNLAVLWRGAFMDAARHWNSRGGGHQPPAGFDVFTPTGTEPGPGLHVTADPAAPWPKWEKGIRYDGLQWKGYTLDKTRAPTFRYTWHGASIEESYTVQTDTITRTLKVTGPVPTNSWLRLAEDLKPIAATQLEIAASGSKKIGSRLVLPIKQGTHTITYRFRSAAAPKS